MKLQIVQPLCALSLVQRLHRICSKVRSRSPLPIMVQASQPGKNLSREMISTDVTVIDLSYELMIRSMQPILAYEPHLDEASTDLSLPSTPMSRSLSK